MDRRSFFAIAVTGLLASRVARAQQADRVWRVGYLAIRPRPAGGAPPPAFRNALQTLGFVDGKSIVYESRWAGGRGDRLRELAADLLSRNVDLVVAVGGSAAGALSTLTSTP